MSEEPTSYSIALRLRRVTYEDSYVAIPVSNAVIRPGADGKPSIDFEALVAEAVRLAENPRVEWQVEEVHTEAHPIQAPLPEGRRRFAAFYDE